MTFVVLDPQGGVHGHRGVDRAAAAAGFHVSSVLGFWGEAEGSGWDWVSGGHKGADRAAAAACFHVSSVWGEEATEWDWGRTATGGGPAGGSGGLPHEYGMVGMLGSMGSHPFASGRREGT